MRKLLLALIALALVPAPASADTFDRIYDDYKADGEIDACRYSDDDLRRAEGQVPPDIDQYAPDFVEQLARARQKRASGGCDPKPKPRKEVEAAPAAPAPAKPRPPGAKPEPVIATPPAPAAPARTVLAARTPDAAIPQTAALPSGGGGAPAALVLLAILAGLAALAGLGALAAWFYGYDLRGTLRPIGASASEAGGRGADLAGEFWDWLRLGR
ncbi:MAG TPA: hypothetical protein VNT32_02640 [Thermoleophilaceae bacterium]|nr:hypothetical protein [Thermoleophilaceae bacterium]